MQIESKKCSTCLLIKPIGDFHRDSNRADGHDPRCKECKNALRRKLYLPRQNEYAIVGQQGDYEIAKPRRDLTGQRFGKLVVLHPVGIKRGENGKGHMHWECECDCGNRHVTRGLYLVNGGCKSCGCLIFGSRRGFPIGFGRAVIGYKKGAESRGHQWLLSDEEALSLFSGDCYYCGAPPQNIITPQRTGSKQAYIYSGIDRVDSSGDYTPSNCVSCCSECNTAKGTWSYEQFIDWIKQAHKKIVWIESIYSKHAI